MALKKDKLTAYGVVAQYWRIRTMHINLKAQQASISLELYLDQESSLASQPLESRNYHIGTAEIPFAFTPERQETENIYEIAYGLIKQIDPDLNGAIDV